MTATEAATEATEAPACGTCLVPLVRREHPDKLAAWLGTWWDHPPTEFRSLIGHTGTVLEPSDALRAQWADQAQATLGPCPDGHRPDDDPEPGDRCKDCGRPITWTGPSPYDWQLAQ